MFHLFHDNLPGAAAVPIIVGMRQDTVTEAVSYIPLQLCVTYHLHTIQPVHTIQFEQPCKGKVLIVQVVEGQYLPHLQQRGMMAYDRMLSCFFLF